MSCARRAASSLVKQRDGRARRRVVRRTRLTGVILAACGAGLRGLLAFGVMSVLARLPLGHGCDGRQKARVPRADELPRAGDGEEEEDDEEHALVVDGAHIAGGSVQLCAGGQLQAVQGDKQDDLA